MSSNHSHWINWPGGDRPVPGRRHVAVRHRDGGEREAIRADQLSWDHDPRDRNNDVVAYRLAEGSSRSRHAF